MNGMGSTPVVIWRQRQDPDDPADPVIGRPMPEESSMTAVVLDHEQPHQKAGGRRRNEERHPRVADIVRSPGHYPEHDEWTKRDRNLNDAAGMAGLSVRCKDLRPVSSGRSWKRVQV